MVKSRESQFVGMLVIGVGIALVAGALMFLLITQLTAKAPWQLAIPAFIQMVLGIITVVAGILFVRSSAAAKFVLASAGVAVVANIAFAVILAAWIIPK